LLITLSSLPGVTGCGGSASGADAAATLDAASPGDAGLADDLSIGADAGDLAGVDLAGTDAAVDAAALLAARPYTLTVPSGYSAAVPTPLLLMIHGYSSDSTLHEAYFKLAPLAESEGFLYVRSDGLPDIVAKRGWNATDACCIFQPNPPDDLTYLTVVLDDVVAKYNVDPKRVFIVGHSNGGFMSNRLACELSSRIAAVVSLAGGNWKNPAHCVATSPVSYLQIHAPNDPTIDYDGGKLWFLAPEYPSAHETVAVWAGENGCGNTLAPTGATVDLISSVAGAETTVEAYSGCTAGTAVELWTMTGIVPDEDAHQPPLNATFPGLVWDFLSAHPKP